MNKKTISVLLIFLITRSLFGCQSTKNAIKPVTIGDIDNKYYKDGNKPVTIENIDNKYYKVVIDYGSGISHKEMGVLFGKEIKSKIPDYEKTADKLLDEMDNVSANPYKVNLNNAKQIMKNVNQDYVDELDGIASQFSGGNDDKLGDNAFAIPKKNWVRSDGKNYRYADNTNNKKVRKSLEDIVVFL